MPYTSVIDRISSFSDYLREAGEDVAFETVPIDDLAKHLRQFYAALQRQDGRQYSKSSYINIRAAINRHLQSPPHSRQINIAHDRPFMSANHVFVGLLKDLKARGLDQTTHKTAISSEDMRKLYASGVLSEDNPRSLQCKVFVELMLHFGRRGREGLRDMRKDSIVIKVDGSGKSYATMAYNEHSKNHQNVLTDKAHDEKQSMMMEQPQRCPVQSLRLYMSKLNDRCDAFWQRPNEKYEGRIWYANRAVGVNTLADMMKVISQEAHLSCTYTNHCLRATSCTVLSDGGIHARHICKLTGHRNESSVAVYARATPIEKRREMNDILHSYGAPEAESDALVPTSTAVTETAVTPAPTTVMSADFAPSPVSAPTVNAAHTPGPTANAAPPAMSAFSNSWARGNFLSGANFYGPVTFNLGLDILGKDS